ncbi:MAG: MFS transporter [Candidatus Dormibacteria bacterium]
MPTAQAPSYIRLLRELHEFRSLWLASSASKLGDAIQLIALLWLAGTLPNPGLAVGVVALGLNLPTLVVGPFAGAVADRLNRKSLLISADLLRAVNAALIPIGLHFLGIPGVVASAFVEASLSSLFDGAYNAALPEIVKRENLLRANAFMTTTSFVAGVVGAGAGGLLIGHSAPYVPFLLNAVSFLFSALMILWIPAAAFAVDRGTQETSYAEDLVGGLRYVMVQRPVQMYILIGTVATIGFAPAVVALVTLTNQTLHAGASGYGLLNAVAGIGAALGSILVGRWAIRQRLGSALAFGLLLQGVLTVALGWSTALWMAASIMVLRTGSNSIVMVSGRSLIQRLVPSELRGRVLTLTSTVQELPRVLILPISGAILDLIGVRLLYAAMATFILLAGFLAYICRNTIDPLPGSAESQTAGGLRARDGF